MRTAKGKRRSAGAVTGYMLRHVLPKTVLRRAIPAKKASPGARASSSSSGSSGRPRVRIDHPHLIDSDDYECSICGRRFSRNQMSCPYCGVRFTDTKEDYEEFDEEEDEWDAWDEEEGL